MHDFRVIDARISKYLDKLKSVDGMAYQLYHVEKENIKQSIQRSIRDERNKKSREAS
jgi:ribosomal protein L20